jgi:putative ABC transport system permease protein
LIVCGIIIDRQLYYFRHTDTGIDRENVVMLPLSSTVTKNYSAFNHDLSALAGISDVAISRYSMFSSWNLSPIDGKTPKESFMLPYLDVDDHFISVLGIKWKYAPPGNMQLGGKRKIAINELAIGKLHLPANPVGSFIKTKYDNLEIVGVVKNFNFTSMQDPIQPLALFMTPDTTKFWNRVGVNLLAKVKPHTNLPSLLNKMQTVYKKYDNDAPFNYTFLDDAFDQQYKAEDRLASIFSIFTGITIALAGMGLFGLAAFTIEQRTKEIGVRKILGASLASLASLLSVDFLKLVLLAIIIGSPVAWWAMHSWLQNFAYRINIQWWMFAAAGLLAVIISIIIISYHALKAAIANPVNSLRSE